MTKTGDGSLTLAGANNLTGSIEVDAGTLRFNDTVAPTLTPGMAVQVVGTGVLELAGTVSAFGGGANGVNISNDSSATSGILISGTNQSVGAVDGTGGLTVSPGSDVSANHIVQAALMIGGTADNFGTVVLDPSDDSGNPQSEVSLPNSSASGGVAASSLQSAVEERQQSSQRSVGGGTITSGDNISFAAARGALVSRIAPASRVAGPAGVAAGQRTISPSVLAAVVFPAASGTAAARPAIAFDPQPLAAVKFQPKLLTVQLDPQTVEALFNVESGLDWLSATSNSAAGPGDQLAAEFDGHRQPLDGSDWEGRLTDF